MDTAKHSLVAAAQSVPLPAIAGAAGQYLIFTLNGESFAIDILCIREIIEYGEITDVPMMPEAIRGVINLRGAVVPVIDLSARFGRSRTEVARRTCIVILELALQAAEGPRTVGIVVDTVSEVLEIPAADIEPAPSFGARLRTDFIAGMARVAGRFVIILELSRVLSLADLGRLADLAGDFAPARSAVT